MLGRSVRSIARPVGVLALLLSLAGAAGAASVTYTTPPGNYTGTAPTYNLGAAFHVTEAKTALAVGRVFKAGSTASHEIGIWDGDSGSLLWSATVTPAVPTSTLAAPLALVAGKNYVLGIQEAGNDPWSPGRNVVGAGLPPLPPFLVLDAAAYNRNASFSYPNLRSGSTGWTNEDWTMTFGDAGSGGLPDPVSNLQATPGDAQVQLTWMNPTSAYDQVRVVRKQGSPPADPSDGTTVFTTPSATSFTDTGLENGSPYHYALWVERGSDLSPATRASATPSLLTKINFQPSSSPVPAGYVADVGLPYDATRGFGWVREDRLGNPAPTPLDVTGRARDRNRAGIDPRLNTLIQMQWPTSAAAAAWEYALPNGEYGVTVSVGDKPGASGYDSNHTVRAEGVTAIDRFQGTAAEEFRAATVNVAVTDGKLTIDAIGGTNTKINYLHISPGGATGPRPTVTGTSPANAATNVFRNTAINVDVFLPTVGAGVDVATLSTANVQLRRTSDGSLVPGSVNTSGGGDAIVYQPTALLLASTNYTFTVTPGVTDTTGTPFEFFSMSFTTGAGVSIPVDNRVAFTKSVVFTGAMITSLVFGPDGRLYASDLSGILRRWTIGAGGALTGLETFSGLSGRTIIGLAFDPTDPSVLWVSHNGPLFPQPAPDFTGKIAKLTIGAGFSATVADYVIGLPRSSKDHLTNSLAFGPDGLLYAVQGSNTAMGAPDSAWHNRPERLLNAAVLQIDPSRTTGLPINVQTEAYDGQPGSYDPYAAGAPVRLYATGIRNAYDLVWYRNGSLNALYVPTNGSAAGGNTPGSPGGVTPAVPALMNVATQNDYLFRAIQGKYYGHPNPLRGDYVLNGGNPTSGVDAAEVVQQGSNQGYPVGTQPDAEYGGFAYDFGRNRSPDGAIQYKSAIFTGALQNKLLVVEYSGGDDILSLPVTGSGGIDVAGVRQVASGFADPLDLAEDTRNGNLYVSEFGSGGRITLLSAPSSGPEIDVINTDEVPAWDWLASGRIGSLTSPPPHAVHDVNRVRVSNLGSQPLLLTGMSLTGPWQFAETYTFPITVNANRFVDVRVRFVATGGTVSSGTWTIQSTDADEPTKTLTLKGVWQPAPEGGNEPSLVRIVNTLFGYTTQILGPGQSIVNDGRVERVGEEILAPYWQRADLTQPVRVHQLAAFHGTGAPATFFYYNRGGSATNVFKSAGTDAQSVLPRKAASAGLAKGSFTPGPVFGLKLNTEHSDPALNDWSQDETCTANCGHHVRAWPLRDRTGALIPNAYLVTMDSSGINYDFNDNVYVMFNLKPEGT